MHDTEEPAVEVIVIMGVTGVGKSTFIQYATGCEVVVGHDLEACTQEVRLFPIKGTNVYLADTPGFDDTHRSDAAILEELYNCLADSVDRNYKIKGAIYIHPITETRMKGSAIRNLDMFKGVIGMNNMANCRLVTTKWSLRTPEAEDRERELRTNMNYWGLFVRQGAQMVRFGDSMESAIEIIRPLVGGSGFVPQVVRETQGGKRLVETEAGQAVNASLEEAKKMHKKELGAIEEAAQEALRQKDLELARLLEKMRADQQAALEQLSRQQKSLQEVDAQRSKQSTKSKIFKWMAVAAAGVAAVAVSVATAGVAAPEAAIAFASVQAALLYGTAAVVMD